MINLLWLVAIGVCVWRGWSTALLGIIAVILMDMALDVKHIRQPGRAARLPETWLAAMRGGQVH